MNARFAAAGGSGIGLGHLARSTALAQALQLRGVGIEATALGSDREIEIDGLRWEPGPGFDDAVFAVLDGYEIDAAAVEALGEMPHFWMHPPPDGFGDELHLDMSGDPPAGGIGGIGFASLRRSYWRGPSERRGGDVCSILVTTGGGDAGGAVAGLAAAARDALPGVRVRMVRGPQSRSPVPDAVDAVDAPPDLHPLLAAADLVVTAAGQTMLESLATQAPTIALVRADNQRRQAELIGRLGGAVIVDEAGLPDTLLTLAEDVGRRTELAAAGSRLVDGLGAHRLADTVLARLLSEDTFAFAGIRLRGATAGDSEMLLELRNDPDAYALYRTPDAVTPAVHATWLERILSDSDRELLIVERDAEALGQVRLDRLAGEGGRGHADVELSISLLPDARGAGAGKQAIAAGCLLAWVRMGARRILASVHPRNEASAGAFRAMGFRSAGRDDEGFDLLALDRASFDWPEPGS